MKKNDVYPMTAERLGADMEGVCRHEGMAVFVPGMLPGETADVRIVKTADRYAFGKQVSAPSPVSSERREPDCDVFPRCGGCTCRHMSYETSLEAKRQQVKDCFLRIAKIDIPVEPVLGMDSPFAYRNKTALPVGGTAERPVLGFYAPRSHDIIPADHCPNAMEPSAEISQVFLSWMRDHRIEPYHEEPHKGLVRHLVIRINRKKESMITVVVNGTRLPEADDLIQRLVPLGVISVIVNENRDRTNVIFGKNFHNIYGKDTLKDRLCGLDFELAAPAFFQVNPVQTEKLYGTALDFAGLKETDTLCDVYCGAGTISLMMARHCRHVTGIEIVPEAIENAKGNALRNGISNVDFHTGKAEDLLPKMVADGLRPDVIVVDPPRKGLEPSVIDAIAEAGPDRVVYVSCNVATQARDTALLVAKGYTLQKVQPVDMFCWTSGTENVILLSKLSSAKHIDVHLDMTELDVTNAENSYGEATYEQIKQYVKEHHNMNVSSLYIAQVKRKVGIIERECYNKPKSEDTHVPQCPPEKEKAIIDAFEHFGMIS